MAVRLLSVSKNEMHHARMYRCGRGPLLEKGETSKRDFIIADSFQTNLLHKWSP